MFRFFTRFPFPIRAGGPPYTSGHPYASAALRQFTKNRKAHTSQATHCSPCLADPHAPRIPIRATFPHVSTAPQCNLQAPKIPTLVSARPASPAPQTRHPRVSTNSLRRLQARCRMPRRGIGPPRPASPAPQTRRQPVSTNSLRLRRRAARRRRQRTAPPRDAASTQWEPASSGLKARLQSGFKPDTRPARRPAPAARIPGEPGQAGPGKSPQMRRRIAQDE